MPEFNKALSYIHVW